MKIKNEIKIGILGIISLFILIWGYFFLKGNNILSSSFTINTGFPNVEGLAIGAPITVKGFQVGAVSDIYIEKSNPSLIVVSMTLNKGTDVPKTAYAKLVSPNIMSGKSIELKFDGSCSGADCLQSGDVVPGKVGGLLDVALDAAKPYLDKIDSLKFLITDFTKNEENGLRKSAEEIQSIIKNLNTISEVMAVLLERSAGNISGTMQNIEAITANIKKNNDQITSLISNVNTITEQIKKADLDKTLGNVNETITAFGQTAEEAKLTLNEANQLIKNLQVLTDLSKQEGLLAAVVHDKKLLADVKKAIAEVNLLVEDIRLHPERYRTVLSGKYKPYGEGKNYKK
jgi:phospholipid/cholesterol/gamma-HCH transport system substrate-binding protein